LGGGFLFVFGGGGVFLYFLGGGGGWGGWWAMTLKLPGGNGTSSSGRYARRKHKKKKKNPVADDRVRSLTRALAVFLNSREAWLSSRQPLRDLQVHVDYLFDRLHDSKISKATDYCEPRPPPIRERPVGSSVKELGGSTMRMAAIYATGLVETAAAKTNTIAPSQTTSLIEFAQGHDLERAQECDEYSKMTL